MDQPIPNHDPTKSQDVEHLGGTMFSTENEPEHAQFACYRDWMSSIAELSPVTPNVTRSGFLAKQIIWPVGDLRLVHEICDPVEARLRGSAGGQSTADHWVLGLHKTGHTVVRSDDSLRQTPPGGVCFASLTREGHLRQDSSETIYLFIPRDLLSTKDAGNFDSLHNRNLVGPVATILADHLLSLQENLAASNEGARLHIAEATLSLLRACLCMADQTEPERIARDRAVRSAALRHLRENLEADISPQRLCQLLGVSRSQLYRIFHEDGGVARIIRRERLAAARKALSNPFDGRRVYQVAESYGFSSAEEFTRAFKRQFGHKPSEIARYSSHGAQRAFRVSGTDGFL